ncbi:MAG: topoisomerase IV [Ruminococcaceae bacterium]|nr:topoisomerase IV [Oscillospiraceae bacterium]
MSEEKFSLSLEGITETLEKNYMPYAMSVIISRAIPEIDGFKPSHRKLLYTMYKMGLLNGNRTKSANVVGSTMKLNPHGDMAIYETMVRLTEGHMALLHPLVDSKGNFGRHYSSNMAFAASRYTEVRLLPICNEIFGDIDKDTVEFVDNYDGTMKEPSLLPTAFPNILVNPNQGIAVGMASNIASFNLREICAATTALMKDKNANLAEFIEGPDFSTGGFLLRNDEVMEKIFSTGTGSVKVRSKYNYDKKQNIIEITEIPYSTTVEAIIDKLTELIKGGKLRDLNDVRDETDKSGLKITLELKRGVDPEKLMARLYKQTPLEDSFSCNFNILINGEPKVLGVRDILRHWIEFRTECIRRMLNFDIAKKEARLHLLEGLEKILLDIDKAIYIVRNTPEDAMVVPNLMSGFGIDKIQAEFVAEIKLRNLNKEYILKRTSEIEKLIEEIADLKRTAESDARIRKLIAKQLEEIAKKYGADRKTVVIDAGEETVEPAESFIEDYNVKVFMSRENYFKKITLVSLRAASEQKFKEGDALLCEAEATNKMEMLFFSDKQNVYKMKLYDIPDTKASALGEYLPNLIGMEPDEKIIYATPAYDFSGFMLFAFESGKVAKVEMKGYETKTNRKKLTNAYGKGKIIGMLYCKEECQVALFSNIDKCVVFNTKDILTKSSRSSQGVQVMTMRRKSLLTRIELPEVSLKSTDGYEARTIPSSGYYLKDEDSSTVQTTLFDE